MSRTVSVSGVPRWLLQYLVAGVSVLLALFLGGQVIGLLLDSLGLTVTVPDGQSGLALVAVSFAVVWLGLTVLWVRRARDWSGSSSMWGPVPEHQSIGRFAEFGGIARHNWERAIRQLPDGDDDPP